MPFEPHGSFKQPPDENAYIWRFIDLPKFLDFLHSGSLYFTRLDNMNDPYEGMMPDEYAEAVKAGRSAFGSLSQQIRRFAYFRSTYFVNCWHLSKHESDAMWKLYAGVDAGIALRSTYSRLKSALNECPDRVFLGTVNYSVESVFGTVNGFKFVMHKRPAFEYEKEIRAVLWSATNMSRPVDFDDEGPVSLPLPAVPGPVFIRVPVDIRQLLIGVVLSPATPPWLPDVIRDVVKRFGYDIPLSASTLSQLSYLT